MKINNFNRKRLRKLEYADYVKGVITIVTKHDPVALKISGFTNRLLELQPQLEGLTLRYGKHPASIELKSLRNVRDRLITAIQSQINSVEAAKLPELTENSNLMLPTLHRFFDDIKGGNGKDKSERIDQFFRVIEGNETKNNALKALGFELLLAKLRENSTSINQQLHVRTEEISTRPKMLTQERITLLDKAIGQLFVAIELGVEEYKDVNFQPIIGELNEWNSSYQALVRSRQTRSNNKAEMKLNDINKTVALSDKTSATA